jgi:two-component system chemotaxis response regulator CheY
LSICNITDNSPKLKLGFEVLGMAKDDKDALAKYHDLKPDIMLVDIELDGIAGIEVTREIAASDPAAAILMLIVESPETPEIIVEAVRAEAKGYIRKPFAI